MVEDVENAHRHPPLPRFRLTPRQLDRGYSKCCQGSRQRGTDDMIDNLTIVLTHGLMLIAVWHLLKRPELDDETVLDPTTKKGRWPRA
jgi:hypothetical protein